MPEHNDVRVFRNRRAVFVLVHIAFVIMNASALASSFWQRTHVEPTLFRGGLVYAWGMSNEQMSAVEIMDAWGTFGQLVLLAVGIYLAVLIARGDKRVPKFYVWYGVALLAFEAVVNRAQVRLWDIPRGSASAPYAPHLAIYAATMVGWVAYVLRSRGVRATFVREPRTMGRSGRLVIGVGALVLIAWPFILNGLGDATIGMAELISPKTTTAGEGFAQGIQAMAAATGLFVLMKYAWHMKNGWMAVLLPVSFAALVFLYVVQSFTLHWRF